MHARVSQHPLHRQEMILRAVLGASDLDQRLM